MGPGTTYNDIDWINSILCFQKNLSNHIFTSLANVLECPMLEAQPRTTAIQKFKKYDLKNFCIVFLIALFCSKQGNGNYKALVFTRWWIQTSESMPNSWIIFDCGIHWSTLFKFECNVCNCAEWCFDGIFIWCGISWFMVRNFLLFFCGKGNT